MNLATIIIDMQKPFLIPISDDRKLNLINSQLSMINYTSNKDIHLFNILYAGVGPFWDVADLVDTQVPEIKYAINSYSKTNESKVHKFKKSHDSAFSFNSPDSKNLIDKLLSLKITDVYLMGVNSDGCVYKSAFDAMDTFTVHVADDTMTSEDSFLCYYPTLQDRLNRFYEPYTPFNGNTVHCNRDKLFYHNNHTEFIKYIENKTNELITNKTNALGAALK